MPLRDHFHPPLSERRPWESLHTTWASTLADKLNEEILPRGYIALEQVHVGAAIEIDTATYTEQENPNSTDGGTGTVTAVRKVWTPAAAPLVPARDLSARLHRGNPRHRRRPDPSGSD